MTDTNKTTHAPTVNEEDKTVTTAGGWIIQNVSSSKGGITHKTLSESHDEKGDALVVTRSLRRTFDHAIIVKDIDAIANARVKQLLRAHCVLTPLGWWADDAGLDKLNEKLAPLAEKLVDLNNAARIAGSNHRGRVGIVPLRLEPGMENATLEIRRALVDKLTDAKNKIREGNYHRETVLGAVRNLPRIVTGPTRNMVQYAVDALAAAIQAANKALRESATNPAIVVVDAVNAVDLSPVDGAIATLEIEEYEEQHEAAA